MSGGSVEESAEEQTMGTHNYNYNYNTASSEIEIMEEEEEEESSKELFEIRNIGFGGNGNGRLRPIKEGMGMGMDDESSLFSFEIGDEKKKEEEEVVYVAVWHNDDEQTSTDALLWTLNNILHHPSPTASASALVYLIHVFPEMRYIPTPIGKLPVSQANPEQKETFATQERIKRRDFLQKFLDLCSASKVRVETILIESDNEAKAVLDLIPILNITRLVLGTSKSTLRKMRSRRGSATVDQILHNAPDFCDVKIICQGKQAFEDQMMNESPTPSPRATHVASPKPTQDHITDTFTCGCFKPKVVS